MLPRLCFFSASSLILLPSSQSFLTSSYLVLDLFLAQFGYSVSVVCYSISSCFCLSHNRLWPPGLHRRCSRPAAFASVRETELDQNAPCEKKTRGISSPVAGAPALGSSARPPLLQCSSSSVQASLLLLVHVQGWAPEGPHGWPSLHQRYTDQWLVFRVLDIETVLHFRL